VWVDVAERPPNSHPLARGKNFPISLHLWHSFGQGRLPRQRPAQAKPVHRSSEPRVEGRKGASEDDGTHHGDTPRRWLWAPDRLLVSIRWPIPKSVRGR